MAPFDERRQAVRVGVNGNLNVESVTAGQPLRLVDVGVGGFRVRSLTVLPLDVVASYRFTTPDRRWSAVFDAKAVYSKLETDDGKTVSRYVSGFAFMHTEAPGVERRLLTMMDHAMGFVSFS